MDLLQHTVYKEKQPFNGKVHFSGILPACHENKKCHHESLRKKGLIKDIRTLLKQLDTIPTCDQYDTMIGVSQIKKRPETGPYRFGLYWPKEKPWRCNRVKSRELIGGKLVKFCDCLKKNGLQDDCRRTLCKGKPWCLVEPFPKCPPFTEVPKVYEKPDSYEMCPDKPYLQSPEYEAYSNMIHRSENRFNEGCVPDNVKLPECV